MDVTTFHRDPQRTGWNAGERVLTPENVAGANFGLVWQSPTFDVVDDLPPRLYATPLYMDKVEMTSAAHRGGVFSIVFAATSNGFVYAVNAAQNGATPPGAILWKTELVRFKREPRPFDGVNMGVQSTPVIDATKKILYVASCTPERAWKVYAINLTNGEVLPKWPITISNESLTAPGLNINEPKGAIPALPGNSRRAPVLGTQRGALVLSPDGTRLYLTFGESPAGWLAAVDTVDAKVVTAFASVAANRNFSGGIWGSGGPAIDEQGNVFVATGTAFGGYRDQPQDWIQSVLKFSDSRADGFTLIGTYTPFNYATSGTADIDLGSGGVCLIPALDPQATRTPHLLALVGKQGNIYLLDRANMPGRLDQRPPVSVDSATDQSLLSPKPQPQFGKKGLLNLFGPYTEKTAAVEQARARSVPAYFRASDGTSYLYVTGNSKVTADSIVNVPPCFFRLKIVQVPDQPAYLEIDQQENTLIFQNPGSPVVTSNGSRGAIVWVLDENATRSTLLNGENAPHPVLYAIDAATLKLLWKSRPHELQTSGKYNEPTIVNGTVFVGTDRIQAFGLTNANADTSITHVDPSPSSGGGGSKMSAIEAGADLYFSGGACATCHQETGLGVAGVFPPLAESEWVSGSEERLIRIILHGMQGKVKVAGKEYSAAAMPGFGEVNGTLFNWSDEKVAQVLTYVRSTWGNGAPPITAKKVSEIRMKEGGRPAWTEEELLRIK